MGPERPATRGAVPAWRGGGFERRHRRFGPRLPVPVRQLATRVRHHSCDHSRSHAQRVRRAGTGAPMGRVPAVRGTACRPGLGRPGAPAPARLRRAGWAAQLGPRQTGASRCGRRRALRQPPARAGLATQASNPPAGLALADPTVEIADFADTAAIIANLDAVVSVDTSVAHLVGAMGKPVLLLDRYDNCWRWLHGRSDSPWYPTLRIFRQKRPGEWGSVVTRAAAALRALVAAKASRPSAAAVGRGAA